MKRSIVPLLFGFLLLGGAGHATTQHNGHARGGPTAAPAPPALMPHQLRTLADGLRAESLEPLPVYVPDADLSCETRCIWST